ncbi:hypothetical protein BDY17DRAFT_110524 [Neohortaea acidophila]|uniref:Uncharacterized protein n=1 Tax=Neohortaea acidophila TaxID=245834 RepID=A0A6A6Q153_9PEZI|nr:uncharacterized protein BDY17DRAFT_110524 [Neohortaea acidophila]KAF2485719.1 hypothetical protein BDY17DRAFT_110524 [Neohortaea acidophila]
MRCTRAAAVGGGVPSQQAWNRLCIALSRPIGTGPITGLTAGKPHHFNDIHCWSSAVAVMQCTLVVRRTKRMLQGVVGEVSPPVRHPASGQPGKSVSPWMDTPTFTNRRVRGVFRGRKKNPPNQRPSSGGRLGLPASAPVVQVGMHALWKTS